MYDIRQFKPSLYLLILMGITGFALASQSPGLLILGAGGLFLNAWLVWKGSFRPIPRLASNIITIAALVYVLNQIFNLGATPVMVIGQYLVLLQLVKLWEQRGNRDLAQLLVLSLLLMVAASINTASLLFGILLILYLFLSLYCCLLFHLKVETDAAKAGLAVPAEKLSPAMLRQDQRYLSRSMRRLTGIVSAVAIAFAVVVFLFFPRGTGANILGPLQMRISQPLVGFSDEVSFQNIARIQQNNEVVAHVSLTKNGQPAGSAARPLLLRGVTLDYYNGAASEKRARWRWTRSSSGDDRVEFLDRDSSFPLVRNVPPDEELWEQHITLQPTGTNVLFAMAGPVNFRPKRMMKIRHSQKDGVLESLEPLSEAIEYDVVSRNRVVGNAPPDWMSRDRWYRQGLAEIDPQIKAFAMRPEVCGTNARGPLATQRAIFPRHIDPLDARIADNIATYLRTNFSYTLDLTDTRRIEGHDPLVAFLYDFKKGHCEYFAGAMTLMCQSLGMQARMVAGFHCDEYNDTPGAGYYIVRQSHAHAWVEVLTSEGWKSFDPTSSIDADSNTRKAGLVQRVKHFFDFLEYTYANHVIAYSNDNRENMVQAAENKMLNITIRTTAGLDPLRRRGVMNTIGDWLNGSVGFWNVSSQILGGFMALMVFSVFGITAWFLFDKWRLRRRAARIGIGSLPADEQLRLARQLGFYDDLLRLLDRRQISRPRHLTPLEFSRSLLFLPAEAYETIGRLTELFYRVRFGRAELSPGRQRHLAVVLSKLEEELQAAGPRA